MNNDQIASSTPTSAMGGTNIDKSESVLVDKDVSTLIRNISGASKMVILVFINKFLSPGTFIKVFTQPLLSHWEYSSKLIERSQGFKT